VPLGNPRIWLLYKSISRDALLPNLKCEAALDSGEPGLVSLEKFLGLSVPVLVSCVAAHNQFGAGFRLVRRLKSVY
jgi:hypothetical protein